MMTAALPVLLCSYHAAAAGISQGDKTVPQEAPADDAAKTASGARVAPSWQDHMQKQLAADKSKQKGATAWGLFSEGGWSDAGQVMVFADSKWQRGRVEVIEPGGKTPAVSRTLTAKELAGLRRVTQKSSKLTDVDQVAFDALTFEFVQMVQAADGTVKAEKRLFVRNPGTLVIPDHDALINAYQALRPKPATAKP